MSFSITALALVNRVNRRRRIEDSAGVSSFEELATLDALNEAVADVLSERDWEFDIRRDQLTTKALIESVTTTTTTGSSNVLVNHSSLTNDILFGDWITRTNLVGSTDYANTSMRVLYGTNVAGNSSLMSMASTVGEAISSTTGEIFFAEYILPSTVRSVIRTRHQERTLTLEEVGATVEFDELFPRPRIRKGSPEQISVGGYDIGTYRQTDGEPDPGLRLIVFPVPDDEYVIDYSYRYRHPELTAADSTLEGVPNEVVWKIVDRAVETMKRDFDRLGEMAAQIGRNARTSEREIHERHKGQSSERRRAHSWDSPSTGRRNGYSIHQGRTIG